jgi:hypothetical protein
LRDLHHDAFSSASVHQRDSGSTIVRPSHPDAAILVSHRKTGKTVILTIYAGELDDLIRSVLVE